ncbi:MAG: alanine racemase [Alphaproteobacteria bacterium]|nr:alanine racemase [Alphaproteobacteria bacterium]
MSHPIYDLARLTVRLGAIAANYRLCQRLAGPAAVAGVVKADGYGLGMAPVARVLTAAGCDTFFVARVSEGVALRSLSPEARIFVLDGVCPQTIPVLAANRLTPVLNSLEEIALWSAAARAANTTYDAAIQVDVGMNRLGLPAYELSTLAAEAKSRLSGLRLVLIVGHLACADDREAAANHAQLDRFRAALAMLPPAPASLAATGGTMLNKAYTFDLVRTGIGLYGGNPQTPHSNPFHVVASLTARVLQVHRVDSGESVGYGATHRFAAPATLATLALGYADGLMRSIGGRGAVAIGGARAPIVGRVSMDLVTIDVSDVPPGVAKAGAEAEFFGETISLESFAAASNTVNYEALVAVGPRVPRRYVDGAVA